MMFTNIGVSMLVAKIAAPMMTANIEPQKMFS